MTDPIDPQAAGAADRVSNLFGVLLAYSTAFFGVDQERFALNLWECT